MARIRTTVAMAAGTAVLAGLVCAPPSDAVDSAVTSPGWLFGVSVVSSTDAWAVGTDGSDARSTVIWHWDGTAWTQSKSPSPGAAVNELFGVDAVSADDVWAVGRVSDVSGLCYALIEHWNGTRWSVVQGVGDTQGADQAALFAVTATGPKDVWAGGGLSSSQAIEEHWNGRRWSQVTSGGSGAIRGLSAFAPDDAWAATGPGGMEHWDGTSWTTRGSADVSLTDIAGAAPDDVWAVGSGGHFGHSFHWDGSAWTAVDVPVSKGYNFFLNSVDAISATDVWAVGNKHSPYHQGNELLPLLKHWNGKRWTTAQRPDGSELTALQGVEGSSSNDVWAVGIGPTPILHWDGQAWSAYRF